MEVGQKPEGGLNILPHGMVVEIALGLVYLLKDALAITDAHQNPGRPHAADRTQEVPSKFVGIDLILKISSTRITP